MVVAQRNTKFGVYGVAPKYPKASITKELTYRIIRTGENKWYTVHLSKYGAV